ncbi:hypothetical protein L7F22_035847 [Adiantum nelumboides]|nr:hypothetical protein [Adiantum nelumboides]
MGGCVSLGSSQTVGPRRKQPEHSNNVFSNHPSSQPMPYPPYKVGGPLPKSTFSSTSGVGEILHRPMEDIRTKYTLGRELGRGQFGITYRCTDKATGELFACKSILKAKLTTKEDKDDIHREVQIMYHLTGHPNIVELRGAYEDEESVHLVMELCEGGELFDRIIAKGKYSERAAAGLCRTIMGVVQTCHSLGVIHRDLKPENFLFLDKTENSPLKAIDFGLSVFFNQVLRRLLLPVSEDPEYADDALLFLHYTLDVLDTTRYALEIFCVATGARINWDKSYGILAGSNDIPTWGPRDFSWLRPGETCRYLWFQVGFDVSLEQQFSPVMQSMRRKLCSTPPRQRLWLHARLSHAYILQFWSVLWVLRVAGKIT